MSSSRDDQLNALSRVRQRRPHVLHCQLVLDNGHREGHRFVAVEAFPWDTAPRYLLRDRDASYGHHFRRRVDAMGITEVVTAPRSPWQNAYVERVIGSIRRECLDHIVIFNDALFVPTPAHQWLLAAGTPSSEDLFEGIRSRTRVGHMWFNSQPVSLLRLNSIAILASCSNCGSNPIFW
jgi:transposase InsO family protein